MFSIVGKISMLLKISLKNQFHKLPKVTIWFAINCEMIFLFRKNFTLERLFQYVMQIASVQ